MCLIFRIVCVFVLLVSCRIGFLVLFLICSLRRFVVFLIIIISKWIGLIFFGIFCGLVKMCRELILLFLKWYFDRFVLMCQDVGVLFRNLVMFLFGF